MRLNGPRRARKRAAGAFSQEEEKLRQEALEERKDMGGSGRPEGPAANGSRLCPAASAGLPGRPERELPA